MRTRTDDTALALTTDADDLRRAANVIARRSTHPERLTTRVLLSVLRSTADELVRMAEDAHIDATGLR